MQTWLLRRWYSSQAAPWFLRPASALFGGVVRLRRKRRPERLPVPVIIVGNIVVGGAGKTPLVIWLTQRLREWGWQPGVISRGYGGRSRIWPREVTAQSDPTEVGDEPVLIARRAASRVAVGPDRLAAARLLLAGGGVDIIVSDDGLQHYPLARDLEIAVVDGSRGIGNGCLLPAGPLREPPERLREVGLVVVNGKGWAAPPGVRAAPMRLYSLEAYALEGEARRPLSDFADKTVHAVAGIGNPSRFFSMLSQHGIRLVMHPFPDHHPFSRKDLDFGDELPVLMTEKDAVKCRGFARANHWVVPAEAEIGAADTKAVQELVNALRK